MIPRGLKQTPKDYRDYSYIKTFHPEIYAGTSVPQFPASYNTDAGFPIPNQNTSGLPDGCTDETVASLAQDLWKEPKDPLAVEAITHANANGGTDVRTSMQAGVQLGWFTNYFNVAPEGNLDWFQAICLASESGVPEPRSISIGSRWFQECNEPQVGGIIPTINFGGPYTNHNWKACISEEIGGQTYIKLAPWEGSQYGVNGFAYLSQSQFNQLMSISGSVAFVGTREAPTGPIYTIDLSFLSYWMSYITSWIGLRYGLK